MRGPGCLGLFQMVQAAGFSLKDLSNSRAQRSATAGKQLRCEVASTACSTFGRPVLPPSDLSEDALKILKRKIDSHHAQLEGAGCETRDEATETATVFSFAQHVAVGNFEVRTDLPIRRHDAGETGDSGATPDNFAQPDGYPVSSIL